MTAPAPSPASESPQGGAAVEAPKRSKRMVVWLVMAPIVVLLLALASANWKTFHLACAKYLMRTDDPQTQFDGARMVVETHIRVGMPLDEVRRLFAPVRVIEVSRGSRPVANRRYFDVSVGVPPGDYMLLFDENEQLGGRRTLFATGQVEAGHQEQGDTIEDLRAPLAGLWRWLWREEETA